MFTNRNRILFPKSHEHARQGTHRLPKQKTLYVTLESTANCDVSIEMTQNKKIEDFEVHHVDYEEKKAVDLASSKHSADPSQESVSPYPGKESTKQIRNALMHMLGTNEAQTNAFKA